MNEPGGKVIIIRVHGHTGPKLFASKNLNIINYSTQLSVCLKIPKYTVANNYTL